jgi:hypothetical protein
MVYYAGAMSKVTSAYPNQGVQGVINVVDMSSLPSTLIAAWVAETGEDSSVIGGDTIWAQVGYYTGEGNTPQAFYQIWNLTADTVLTSGFVSVSTGYHTFSMQLMSGTTWGFYLDGVSFGSYNLGVSAMGYYGSEPLEALVEEQGTTASFPDVEFTVAFEVYLGGAWVPVQSAYAYIDGPYGTVGTLQDSALASNQIVAGPGVTGSAANGATLWSSSAPAETVLTLSVTQL